MSGQFGDWQESRDRTEIDVARNSNTKKKKKQML